MGRYVSNARRVTSGSGSRRRGRVSNLSRRSVRPHSKATNLPDPQLATDESPETVKGITRAGFTGRSNLEKEDDSLDAVGGPHCWIPVTGPHESHWI